MNRTLVVTLCGLAAAATGLLAQDRLKLMPGYDNFTKQTGVPINVNVFGSNEEMLAKLQAGSTGWDVLVPTNYTISTYKGLDLIQPLDLARLPNYDAASNEARFTGEGIIDGTTYAVPKDWGTTGFIVNTKATTEAVANASF